MALEGLVMPKKKGKKMDPDDLLEAYVEDCKLQNMTMESIRHYQTSLKIFIQYLGEHNITPLDLDVDTLREFLSYLMEERKVKFKTLENYFSVLSSFYDYLLFDGHVDQNLVLPFRKRYLKRYKNGHEQSTRQLLSVEQLSALVSAVMDPRDRAMIFLLAKTGIRRGEMLKLDVGDINWSEGSLMLKPTPKRSNRRVFFDDEASRALQRWMRVRDKLLTNTDALFVSYQTGSRLSRNAAWKAIVNPAIKLGFHNPNSDKFEDHFGPHCLRHWFTTHLIRSGMPREHVKELRGDRRAEAIDIYHHIDAAELRRMYLSYIPKLRV